MKGIKDPNKKRYVFSPKIKVFLEKELQYSKDKRKINDKKRVAIEKENVEYIEKLKKEFEDKYKNRRTEKLRFLDQYIFPSMANLVVFFEYLAKHPEIIDLFEDDIMELLGIDQAHSNESPNNFIFDRFLNAIIRSSVTRKVTVKLYLLKCMQYIIYQELIDLSGLVLRDQSINMISQDISRPLDWLQILSKTSSNHNENVKETILRPVKF